MIQSQAHDDQCHDPNMGMGVPQRDSEMEREQWLASQGEQLSECTQRLSQNFNSHGRKQVQPNIKDLQQFGENFE